MSEAIYDARVNATLEGMRLGKSREDLAVEFELSSWKSVDMYMRRKGFAWDSHKQTYIPKEDKVEKLIDAEDLDTPIKVEQVIRKFDYYGKDADARNIAKLLGFDDHRAMGQYMETKGYLWSSEKNNYVSTLIQPSTNKLGQNSSELPQSQTFSSVDGEIIMDAKYLPMLEFLYRNQDRLKDVLITNITGVVPKYAVPGKAMTKSIYMSNLLAKLVGEYCHVKNLTQRDVVEAAIVEFLKRNGFELEIEKLLAKK